MAIPAEISSASSNSKLFQRATDSQAAKAAFADRVRQASVTLVVDTVIFEAGKVWGRNAQRFDDEIVQRKLAAVEFSKLYRDAVARGEGWQAKLKTIATTADKQSDYWLQWETRFIAMDGTIPFLSCNLATGNAGATIPGQGTKERGFTWTKSCAMPIGESSSFDQFATALRANTAAGFTAQLQPRNVRTGRRSGGLQLTLAST